MAEWKRVRLGDVLTHRKEFITIDDLSTYKRCRVQVRAQGVVLRDTVSGSDIKTKRQQVCRAGEFLVAEIDAKVGGFGLIPVGLDGAVVSSHYFLFQADPSKIDKTFLDLYSKTPEFMEQVGAQGSTNYAAIRPSHVMDYTMPLPPLPEQQRIVARVKSLLEKVEEARGLRADTKTQLNDAMPTFVGNIISRFSVGAPTLSVADIALSVTDGDHQPPPKSDTGIPFIMISNITKRKLNLENTKFAPYSYFDGLSETRKPKIDDVLYSAVGATYGRPCLVDVEEPFCFKRHIAIIRPNKDIIIPKYLWWALQSKDVYDQATSAITGTAQPTVPLREIRNLYFPVLKLTDQIDLVKQFELYETVFNSIRHEINVTQVELDALPSSILARAFAGAL